MPHRARGTVRNFVCGRAVEHYACMALMKRSPKITANWALAGEADFGFTAPLRTGLTSEILQAQLRNKVQHRHHYDHSYEPRMTDPYP